MAFMERYPAVVVMKHVRRAVVSARPRRGLLGAACAVLFCFLAVAGSAQNLTAVFVDGDARAQRGSSWVALSTGDVLPSQSVVQLGDRAYLELQYSGGRITLSHKGTYRLQSVLSSARALGSAGAAKALLQSLSRITSGTPRDRSSASGARAAPAEQEDDSPWVTSSAQPFLDSGKAYRRSGQYDRAIAELTRGLEQGDDQTAAEIHFELAAAYRAMGDTRNALKQAAGLQPGETDAWAADFVILEAALLVDTYAFDQAVSWLTQPGNDLSADPERGPTWLFLLGESYQGVGDDARAKAALSRVVQSGPGDLADAAARLLQDN
jgi:tetratricopeptide (TPR) repeat protein